jgi:hypothetical protein
VYVIVRPLTRCIVGRGWGGGGYCGWFEWGPGGGGVASKPFEVVVKSLEWTIYSINSFNVSSSKQLEKYILQL